jgi:hypothetical protein
MFGVRSYIGRNGALVLEALLDKFEIIVAAGKASRDRLL